MDKMRSLELFLATCDGGSTPLSSLLRRRPIEAEVDLLLHHGADPNLRIADGTAPLEYAIRRRCRKEIISVLVKYGANLESLNVSGQTILELSIRENENVLPTLISSGADVNQRNQLITFWREACVTDAASPHRHAPSASKRLA